jgi:hypothetical protein
VMAMVATRSQVHLPDWPRTGKSVYPLHLHQPSVRSANPRPTAALSSGGGDG